MTAPSLGLSCASKAEQRTFTSVANVTIGMVAIVFGSLLGALASLKAVTWVILATPALTQRIAAAVLHQEGCKCGKSRTDRQEPSRR